MSTARKGKTFGYFADNTPLAMGETVPPYQPSIDFFLEKIKKNINLTEQFYASIERQNKDPKEELSRAKVYTQDITSLDIKDWNITKNSVAGIITSPPYLCMIDYTLGNRLSYYWLFPDDLTSTYKLEIGSRRGRTNPDEALKTYLKKMEVFAKKSSYMLKKDGFLATVIGEPQAKAFVDKEVIDKLDSIFAKAGFELLWSSDRPINWHRNHGYSSLETERVAVHIKK